MRPTWRPDHTAAGSRGRGGAAPTRGQDEDVVASGRIHLVARSEKAAPAWIWPASTRRCRGNT